MNKFEKRSMIAYNKKADNYDNTSDGKFTLKFKNMLLQMIDVKDDNTVLDVACGNGRFLKMLSDKYSFNGYGTDISDKMIEQAKLLNPSMDFSVGSCERMPFADNFFDVIITCAAYHHFPNVNNFAKEAYRVLKKNGKIYIADVYYPKTVRAINNLLLPLLRAGDVRIYSPDEITETLKNAGFQNNNYVIDSNVQIVNAYR